VLSNKQKFNIKYKQDKDKANSKADITRLTGIPKRILDEVFDRAIGARKTNPESVRRVSDGKKVGGKSLKGKMSGEQWGYSRIYSFVMKQPGTWKTADADLAKKVKALKIKGYMR